MDLTFALEQQVEDAPTAGIGTGKLAKPVLTRGRTEPVLGDGGRIGELVQPVHVERHRAVELRRMHSRLVSQNTLQSSQSWIKRCVLRTGDRFVVHSEMTPSRELQVPAR